MLIAGLAFVAGVLLFLMLWWNHRNNDFYRAEALPKTAEGQQFEPLPAPMPADESGNNASGMGESGRESPGSAPDIASAPAPAVPAPAPPPPRQEVPVASSTAPVPIESPAPRYPRDALRNGESGTVLLRVHVGPDGTTQAVDLVQGSGSRSLDRAATEAVKRWRFQPAQRNGEAVDGVVQVPIAFNADD